MKVAFLGLGAMGYPMAGHLKKAGLDVCVYNRTQKRAEQWVNEFSGQLAASPAEAAAHSDFVFACVGGDADLRAVTLGQNGAFAGMKPGAIFADHTSTSAKIARELSAYIEDTSLSIGFIDAPVSGGQSGAENGQLTIMCGGQQSDFERIKPVMAHYARLVTLMGGVGSGQLTKMVNQICIAGLLQALSEGIHFAQNAELDIDLVLDVISKGAAGSWQMDNRGTTMAQDSFDFGFAVNWMRKDLGNCLDEGFKNGSSLPVTALVDQFYATLQQLGNGRMDTSSLIRLLQKNGNPNYSDDLDARAGI